MLKALDMRATANTRSRIIVHSFFCGVTLVACIRFLTPKESLELSSILSAAFLFSALTRAASSRFLPIRSEGLLRLFKRIDNVLFAGACIAAAPVVASELGYLLFIKSFEFASPLMNDVMEGVEAVKTALTASGVCIYSKASGYPYLVTIYPPLFYYISSIFMLVHDNALIANRATSVVSSFGLFAIVYRMSFRITRSHILAAVLVSMILLSPSLGTWLVLGRPDMLVWLLALASMSCIVDSAALRFALLGGVLMALAAFVKQQAWPVFAATMLYLMFAHRKNALLVYLTTVIGSCLLLFFVFQWQSQGMFWDNIYEYPKAYSESHDFRSHWLKLLQFKTILFDNFLYVLAVALCAIWADSVRRRVSMFGLCFVFSLASLYILFGTWGVATNYIILTIITIYLTIAVSLWRTWHSRRLFLCVFIMMFYSTSIHSLNPLFFNYKNSEERYTYIRRSYREELARVEYLLLAAEKPILSDTDSGYFLTDKPYFKSIQFFDGNHMSLYTKLFPYDFERSQLINDIQSRRFEYILINPGAAHPQEVIQAIEVNYGTIISGKYVTMYFIPR